MKQLSNLFIGLIMLVVGGAMFLRNITVTANKNGIIGDLLTTLFGNNGTTAKGVTGMMMVLVFVMLIVVFVKPHFLTISGLILSALLFVFSIIGGMEIKMADMNGLELAIVVGMMLAGLGITIRSLITPGEKDSLEFDI